MIFDEHIESGIYHPEDYTEPANWLMKRIEIQKFLKDIDYLDIFEHNNVIDFIETTKTLRVRYQNQLLHIQY